MTDIALPAQPAWPALGSGSTVIYCIYSTDCQKRTPVTATASTPAAPGSRSRLDPTFEKTDSANQASTFRPSPPSLQAKFFNQGQHVIEAGAIGFTDMLSNPQWEPGCNCKDLKCCLPCLPA